jgi:hypothetical protein
MGHMTTTDQGYYPATARRRRSIRGDRVIIRVLERYEDDTARGCCYLCIASPRVFDTPDGPRRERIVDTGVSIDYEGRLAICELCLREMAKLLGMVDGSEIETLRADFRQVLDERDAALRRADAADAASRALIEWSEHGGPALGTAAEAEEPVEPEPATA